jgi:opacity protein-like surface antigen
MNKYIWTCIILAMTISPSVAQGKRAEVFVGYSNLQADRSFDDLGNLSNFSESFKRNGMHGVEGSITGFPVSWLGITGDFSYHRKENSTSITGGASQYKREAFYFMAGPTLKIRNPSRVEPFVRGLIGGAHLREEYTLTTTTTTGSAQAVISPSTTKLALGLGGGLDVRLGDKFSLRLIQVDYTPIFTGDRVFNVNNNTIRLDKSRNDNVRISVGVVF